MFYLTNRYVDKQGQEERPTAYNNNNNNKMKCVAIKIRFCRNDCPHHIQTYYYCEDKQNTILETFLPKAPNLLDRQTGKPYIIRFEHNPTNAQMHTHTQRQRIVIHK